MAFNAIVVEKDADGRTGAGLRRIGLEDLPDGEVTVAVDYSTVNYKDGLCLGPGAGLVRRYPHVPGVDLAGRVEASSDPRYRPGDPVVLTGWRVGEAHWGGYAQKARVKADWLVPLPEGLTLRQAMAIGTAGLTAMLAVIALEDHGLRPSRGPVLVTGASGGVGSVAVALLARLGYEVAAVTGRPDGADYLTSLGAARIVPRAELADAGARPLESETWAAAVDAVGGPMLSRVTKQLKYRCAAAAVGNAGGVDVPLSIIPFLLRGVSLLGIDSVLQPFEARQKAWARLVRDLDLALLETMIVPATLADVPALGADILGGRVRGRVVVDVNA
jgi:acrylyl-CoA reductase (NADPH)